MTVGDSNNVNFTKGWRARSSYLEVNASSRITDTILGLLRQVKE